MVKDGESGDARQRLLVAAERCFSAHGYAATTRQIAEAAGVTQPLLLHYFGSKEQLFRTVLDEALRRLLHRQQRAMPVEGDLLDFVVHGLRSLIAASMADPTLTRLAAWGRLAGVPAFTAEADDYWRSVWIRLCEAQAQGYLRSNVDMAALLFCVDGAIKGVTERVDAYGNSGSAFAPPPDRLIETLAELLVLGAVAPAWQEEALRRLAHARGR